TAFQATNLDKPLLDEAQFHSHRCPLSCQYDFRLELAFPEKSSPLQRKTYAPDTRRGSRASYRTRQSCCAAYAVQVLLREFQAYADLLDSCGDAGTNREAASQGG